jgi:glycosyltransferase involved in cell wall biosynthesis
MGYGNCILAFDTVFNREVLGDTGVFWPKDRDALAHLMRDLECDPSRVESLRALPQRRILERYTWEKISQQYEDLFLDVAGNGKGR